MITTWNVKSFSSFSVKDADDNYFQCNKDHGTIYYPFYSRNIEKDEQISLFDICYLLLGAHPVSALSTSPSFWGNFHTAALGEHAITFTFGRDNYERIRY